MKQTFSDLSTEEFDALIDGYIKREANNYGEMPAEFFFDLLLERIAAQTEEMVNLEVAVEDDRLVLTPTQKTPDVIVRDNEILVGRHRLIFQLAHV